MDFKQNLRKNMIDKRNNISFEYQKNASEVVCKKIILSPIYRESNVIYLYSSIKNEIELTPLFFDAVRKGKIIAFPKVLGDEMSFYTISDFKQLSAGAYGIQEPVSNILAPAADLIIVPGVAFTKKGNRLGYGGGYYDKYLASNPAYTIGVAYDFQIVDYIEINKFDVKLKEIITEK